MIPIGNHFGFIGGVSWLVILLTLVFLFFILITVCAKKDSWVRALSYTAVGWQKAVTQKSYLSQA